MDWIFGLVLMLIGQVGVLCMCDRDLVRSWDDWVIDLVAVISMDVFAIGFYVFLNNGL